MILAEEHQTSISTAVSFINVGDLATAETILSDLTRHEPNHAVVLYLLGLIAIERHCWSAAETHLRKALQYAPTQPKIYQLLARTLCALERPDEALALCLSAPNPDNDLRFELAKCHETVGDLEAAATVYRTILLDDPCPESALHVSQFLCRISRPVEAEAVLRPFFADEAKVGEGIQSRLRQQLGLTLKLQKRYEKALSELNAASNQSEQERVRVMEYAGLLAQLGRFEEAAETYAGFLKDNPLDLEVHSLLNDVYHSLGRHDLVGVSYDNSLFIAPDAASLPAAKGRLLQKLDHFEAAEQSFREALRIAPTDASAMIGLAKCFDRKMLLAAAREIHERNVSYNPSDANAWEAFGQFLLLHADPRLAVSAWGQAVKMRPTGQSGLAGLGLAYRACGDGREQWLNDYDRDVQVFDLPPPEGYGNMAAFNADLSAYLLTLHADSRQYLSQTLRGGTQTYEELFYQGHNLVDILLARINAAIRVYRERLADRAQHPFASRLGRNFRHVGSWSSCLKSDGYHVNHIHQKGWISSCYYVSVPDAVSEGQQGWLKFGEPSSDLGLNWGPRRVVQPKVGRLVLFPSYLWHGTVAFRSPQQRITIAFDTVPA